MSIRIYIADDHAMVRRGLAAIFSNEPDFLLCGEAADCAVATSEIEKLRPDVAVVDISLQGNNGIELIKNIKAFDPQIRIVVFSVHDEAVYALRVLKAGAKAYVSKQDVTGKVIDAIRRVHRGQLFVSEQVSTQLLNRMVTGRAEDSAAPVASLSDRELEVVTLIGSGLSTREVAMRIRVSVKTIETHRAHIKAKLGLSNSVQLVQFCFRWVDEGSRTAAQAF